MTTQNCVSGPNISRSSAGDSPKHSRDVGTPASPFDGSEKVPGVHHVSTQYDRTYDPETPAIEEKSMAATSQVPNSVHPHGLKLAAIVVALCLATLLAALDQTIMATAAPNITDHFKSIDDIGWYAASYLLAKAVLQPSFGRIYSTFNVGPPEGSDPNKMLIAL
ncbi:hypothetical protein KCU83_g1022, partial [Aureobasidium melanogenum]